MFKKLLITSICLLGSFFSIYSQNSFYFGLQYSYNSTWLINKQVIDAGPDMDYVTSFGSFYGQVLGFNFTDKIALELNVNLNKLNQEYVGIMQTYIDGENPYNSDITIKTIDLPLLFKYGNKFYFEFGPVFQLMTDAVFSIDFEKETQTILISSVQNNSNAYSTGQANLKSEYITINQGFYNGLYYEYDDISNLNVEDQFYNSGFGLAFGFGTNINLIEDILFFNVGLRVNYILTDYKGVNALGLRKHSEYISNDERVNFYSKPLYGGIKLGLIYNLN